MGKYGRQHIGKTFNEGKLTVVDGGDKVKYVKVKCCVCEEDSELFGDGVFETQYYNITKGQLPCGCAPNVRWTLDQHKIRINRKILNENLPVKFVGFGKEGSRIGETEVKLCCVDSNTEFVVGRIDDFYKGYGNKGVTYTVEAKLKEYSQLPKNSNYTVWETGNKNTNRDAILGFHCSVCESNGVESLFTILACKLFRGSIPCYCSATKEFSGEHVVGVSKKRLYEQGVENLSVLGAFKKEHWHIVFICNIHGVYSRRYNEIVSTGCHCPKCAAPKFGYDRTKKGYLYLLEIQTQGGLILGYGITNKLNNRLTTHRKNLKTIVATITNMQVFEGSGTAVLSVENAIKSLHTTGLLDCEGFRRESISIDRKDEVLELCKKLKQLDNPDKLI